MSIIDFGIKKEVNLGNDNRNAANNQNEPIKISSNIIVYAGFTLVFLPSILISFFALESPIISIIGLVVYILFVGCIALPDQYWDKILCCTNFKNENEFQLRNF